MRQWIKANEDMEVTNRRGETVNVVKGMKTGLMEARKSAGRIFIGWASWDFADEPDVKEAERIALTRIFHGHGLTKGPHPRIRTALLKFIDRANRWYKDADLSDSAQWLFNKCGGQEKLDDIWANIEAGKTRDRIKEVSGV